MAELGEGNMVEGVLLTLGAMWLIGKGLNLLVKQHRWAFED
ncbi:hypothetical protein [Shigella flexneri]|jgi:hypothetical protein|nr:hypothetical protein [Shigella flexneri]